MAIRGTQIPEVLKWRTRLFMSVDIVGSTALKQPAVLQPVVDSLVIIQGFYGEAVLAVEKEWAQLSNVVPADKQQSFLGPPPEFWKTIGDEIFFCKEVTDSRQVALTVECWKGALMTGARNPREA